MPDDPIERLNIDVEVFGIPQTPGMPPMTESFLHIRRRQDGAGERAVLGLPAYEGRAGDRGPAGMVHQGTRSLVGLEGLAMTLGENELNFTYRREGTDDLWVWTGSTFITYPNAFGTKGDKGDPPVMQGGTVTVDGETLATPAGVRVDGASGGPYTVGIDLPELPKGDPGPPGPAGPIYTSVSVDQTTPPTDRQILVHDAASGKLKWRDAMLPVEEYTADSSGFPASVTKQKADVDHLLASMTLPARPYAYRPNVSGGIDIKRFLGHQIDVEIRIGTAAGGDAVSGELVGIGRGSGSDVGGWDRVRFEPYWTASLSPGSSVGVIPANTEVVFFIRAVRRSGTLGPWEIRNSYAQFRVRLDRVV